MKEQFSKTSNKGNSENERHEVDIQKGFNLVTGEDVQITSLLNNTRIYTFTDDSSGPFSYFSGRQYSQLFKALKSDFHVSCWKNLNQGFRYLFLG